jgi:small conductance mechanosensitive channel
MLRTTRIITTDGRILAAPNSIGMNKTVTSHTNFPHLRPGIAVTIGLKEYLDRVRSSLLALIPDNSDSEASPKPRMVTKLNDYDVAIEFQAWLKDEREHMQKRFDLREAVFNGLTPSGIDMPLETIRILR